VKLQRYPTLQTRHANDTKIHLGRKKKRSSYRPEPLKHAKRIVCGYAHLLEPFHFILFYDVLGRQTNTNHELYLYQAQAQDIIAAETKRQPPVYLTPPNEHSRHNPLCPVGVCGSAPQPHDPTKRGATPSSTTRSPCPALSMRHVSLSRP
jgi:hypothetical protein